jgi:glycosyltransferase involved in cell wall biosynthesis
MKPLSLIHAVNAGGLGGTGATAFRLARLLAGRGHRMLFCVPPGSVWAERAAAAGLECSTELALEPGFRPLGFLRDLRALRRLVRERGAQVVHVHRSAEYWRAALALGGARDGAPGRPKLVRSRGVVTPLKPHALNRWLHGRRTDLVVCTAQVIFDMYRALPGFDAGRIELLHDGVDLVEFRPGRPDGPAVRAELGIPPDAPVVAVIARLAPVKGHRHLVEAAPAILARNPKTRFLLAGRPARRSNIEEELRTRARELGVEASFVFAGSPPDVSRLLAAADIFLLASVGSEGSSRGTAEAMAAGLPAVASRVGCLPDMVVEGGTGFLVPPGDPAQLAGRVSDLLADPELRGRMGRAARARAEAEFDERRVAERIEALYYRILGD